MFLPKNKSDIEIILPRKRNETFGGVLNLTTSYLDARIVLIGIFFT